MMFDPSIIERFYDALQQAAPTELLVGLVREFGGDGKFLWCKVAQNGRTTLVWCCFYDLKTTQQADFFRALIADNSRILLTLNEVGESFLHAAISSQESRFPDRDKVYVIKLLEHPVTARMKYNALTLLSLYCSYYHSTYMDPDVLHLLIAMDPDALRKGQPADRFFLMIVENRPTEQLVAAVREFGGNGKLLWERSSWHETLIHILKYGYMLGY